MSKVVYHRTSFVLYGPLYSFTAWVVGLHMRREQGEAVPPVLPGMENVRVNEVAEGTPTSPPEPRKNTWMLLRWNSIMVEIIAEGQWSHPGPAGGGWPVWTLTLDRLMGGSTDVHAEFVYAHDYRTDKTPHTLRRTGNSYEWTNDPDGIMHVGPRFDITDLTYDHGKDLTHDFMMET